MVIFNSYVKLPEGIYIYIRKLDPQDVPKKDIAHLVSLLFGPDDFQVEHVLPENAIQVSGGNGVGSLVLETKGGFSQRMLAMIRV